MNREVQMKQAITMVALVILFFSFSVLRGQTATLGINPSESAYFGSVIVGEHRDYDITLSAIGTTGTSLMVSYVLITGDESGQFQVISAPATPFTILVGIPRTITVRYTPTRYGYYSCSLMVMPVSGAPKTITLEGVGRSNVFKANPSAWDFGNTGGAVTFWVSVDPNNGMGSTADLVSATITGNSAFSIVSIRDMYNNLVSLPAFLELYMDSLQIQVAYNPINNEYVAGAALRMGRNCSQPAQRGFWPCSRWQLIRTKRHDIGAR